MRSLPRPHSRATAPRRRSFSRRLGLAALPLFLLACTSADSPGAESGDADEDGDAESTSASSEDATSGGEAGETTDGTDTSGSTETGETTEGPEGFEIIEGLSVGPIALESTFGEAVAQLGEPDLVFVTNAVGFARYDDLGLELVLSSPEKDTAPDDSLIFAIGVKKAQGFYGDMMVGQTKSEVQSQWGDPDDGVEGIQYFGEGISAMFDANDEVEEIGIFAAYQNAPEPPEMATAPQGDQP